MIRLIDREMELRFLLEKYKSNKAEFIVIWGRRRIGKTWLVAKSIEGKKALYFLGRRESKEETIERMNRKLIELTRDTSLLSRPLRDWEQILEYLGNLGKIIVILDEFQYILDRFPELPGILQDFWDRNKESMQLKLVLTGSSVGMMEREVLSSKSPLYGRRTGQWKLGKIPVTYLPEFFPDYSIESLVKIFSITDMIPGYLVRIDPERTVEENIVREFLFKGGFFYSEAEFLLKEELREPSNYMTILETIASGSTRLGEISSKTGFDKSYLSKYLKILVNLDIVQVEAPIFSSKKKRIRGSLFKLSDNYFDFWFNFVYPNRDWLEVGRIEEVQSLLKRDINQYYGYKFEEFCRRLLSENMRVGRWWHKDKEIDIVGIPREGPVVFGEAKWREDLDAREMARDLMERVRLVPYEGEYEIWLFGKSFKRKIRSHEGVRVRCVDLRKIERMVKRRKV